MTTRGGVLRVAIVGAGPAGMYAANALMDSGRDVSIDLLERLPAPFGLIRYGVAPDHPRIKGIVSALHRVLDRPQVRLFGNITYGKDVDLETLRRHYDAVVFATGADTDQELAMPGVDLSGSHGAADFVAWYDGHPDAPPNWDLDAERVAVLGVGNVALDVARVLAKSLDELLGTDIPDNVAACMRLSRAREVHVFGRRGPAQAKFSPLELRELDHSNNFQVVVDPADMVLDTHSIAALEQSKQLQLVVSTLRTWSERQSVDVARTIFLHFFEDPVEVLGRDGRVIGLRTERTTLDGLGGATGTGRFTDWPIESVYRAVGYRSRELRDLPFDPIRAVVPNVGGRVIDRHGVIVDKVYVTGWIKRGPVGLIGHTKSDANETVTNLLADVEESTDVAEHLDDAFLKFVRENVVDVTSREGWYRLDAYERRLGAARGRERIKVVDRERMVSICVANRV
ncbi:pyridine nucleotide-disulfide oxidoreductase [Rhodococcus sp. 05-340-1]|uniref:FAD-dependent oxidoreductase n=1 Tax=Nocardiaceae TaxID=85025 RepID=UPI00050CB56B|nr:MULTISPECIES: FAD-dependent oxidoreductase [Rhodococcus]OZC87708.1 pyridine nucleotide-disulfide oxidoreductase [Rhodococcus sp. 06-412-2C]OZC96359.1 pyridine nucleotide-disulfide oxidoreductase [Rhodococcus sp. 06-412-2B]OZD65343.1 pyridine nucleotide-disulfide oxidoreductase [Rhodococcus sp. 05-340-2]OZD74611.1 pyridine nucleotide-disulfide oxidoreductase [Rhodococcus sp. 05-340-1]OZD86616.1 pyridine nucleotide-disulfide oxidoreductase [Rhodococcus sp. 05-339-2]